MFNQSENIYILFDTFAKKGENRVHSIGYDNFHMQEPCKILRYQPTYTLHYVLGGRGRLFFGGNEYHIEKDTFFFLPPFEKYRYYPDENAPWDYVWFELFGEDFEFFISQINLSRNSPVRLAKDPTCVRNTVNHLFLLAEQGKVGMLNVMAALFSILETEAAGKENSQNNLLAEKARKIILNNYTNPDFSIADIASELFISHSYLCRVYRSLYQTSPKNDLIGFRLSLAYNKLTTSTEKIIQIARDCGFHSELTFTKSFKLHFGFSPSELRK